MPRLLQPKEGPLCRKCPLFDIGIVIMDRLPVTDFSGLSVIGEMSGAIEVKKRAAFTGPTGKLFKAICNSTGVPIDTLHVTNCIACGMDKGGRPSDKDAKKIVECCRPLLVHNMHALGTKVACATGAVPWESLSGLKGINKYRGCVMPQGKEEPWMLTATLHPAGLLQNEATRIGLENVRYDIRKAYDLARGTRGFWDADIRDAQDVEDLLDFLETALWDDWVLAVDVETDGIDPWSCNLTTIGVAGAPSKNDEPESWSIPWGPAFGGFYQGDQWDEVLYALKELHKRKEQTIVFHNFTYDVPVLARHFEMEITADIQDTLLLDHAAFPKLPHNLQNLASRYLVVEPWKDEFRASEKELHKKIEEEYKTLDGMLGMEENKFLLPEETYLGAVHIEQLDEQGVGELLWYNAMDTAATWKLYWKLLEENHEINTYNVYLEDMELVKETMNWTETGIRIDMDVCEQLDAEYSLELIERKGRLQEMCGFPEPAEIAAKIDHWQTVADDTQEDLTEARRVCFACNKKCGSTAKTLAHAKEVHEGDEKTWNAIVIRDDLELLKTARAELKVLRKTPTRATFNPASPPQLRRVFALRGLVPTKVTKKTLEVSTSKESLWDLRDDPFVDELFRWRKLAKLHSTYIKNMATKLGPDGRLHPTWKIHATPSGRFGTAPAVQNWPKAMKALMIPEEGNKIVGADYAALELRIIALLSGQEDLIEAFLQGTDIHSRHAGWFFPNTFPEIAAQWEASGDTEEERDKAVPEYGALRGAGKPVTFGKNYRAGPNTLYETIRAQREDVKTVKQQRELLRQVTMMSNILDSKYSNIVDWSDIMNRRANENMYLKTEVVGRIRKWPMGEVPPTESANHPVQGMAGDIMNRATLRLVARLKEEGLYHNGVWPILQIHDALYLECYEEVAERAARILEESMRCEHEVVAPTTGKKHKMFFDASAKVADNVKDAA